VTRYSLPRGICSVPSVGSEPPTAVPRKNRVMQSTGNVVASELVTPKREVKNKVASNAVLRPMRSEQVLQPTAPNIIPAYLSLGVGNQACGVRSSGAVAGVMPFLATPMAVSFQVSDRVRVGVHRTGGSRVWRDEIRFRGAWAVSCHHPVELGRATRVQRQMGKGACRHVCAQN